MIAISCANIVIMVLEAVVSGSRVVAGEGGQCQLKIWRMSRVF